MSSAAGALAWRPGVVHGPRPERRDERPPLAVRLVRSVDGLLRTPWRARRSDVSDFAQRVDAEARRVAGASERAFDDAVAALREALLARGLDETLAPWGFAVVREAAERALGLRHHDVQLFGGLVLGRGQLAELETGEGKTLTATLPAALAALAGIPVHAITANDYLVRRDAEAMGPLYARLGLRTGCVTGDERDRAARRAAYARDVVYVSPKQVAFDYLQDRLLASGDGPAPAGSTPPEGERAPVLRGLCFAIVDEADAVLIDDARTPLLLSRPGAPADEPTVRLALWLARRLDEPTHYRVDGSRGTVSLTPAGHARLAELAGGAAGPLAGPRRRAEWVERALAAERLYERDRHYLVRDGRVDPIDLPTGRRAPDRCFESVVQAAIELREGLALTPQRETAARITHQRFFRRYLRLAGTTGTAREAAGELWSVYGLRTVTLPTRLPSARRDAGFRLFASAEARAAAVVERIAALHAAGRPVLVGVESVAAARALGARLAAAGLPHALLTAEHEAEEARIVARAGEAGRITVATRMAGRGTDIPLGPGAAEAGGLAVIATEIGESVRIDRQLFGRCGRQGAPGSHEQWASLEDRVVAERLPPGVRSLLSQGVLPPSWARLLTKIAQRAEERRGVLARRLLMASERALEERLAFSGRGE